MTVYTLGVWKVKRGREDEFIAAWHALGQWTLEQGFHTHGTLLRDHSDPSRFVSFGPWPSVEVAERWGDHPGFGERLAAVRRASTSYEPGTYDVVLSVS